MNTTNRTDNINPYLEVIADQLWSNNASVMVGAGFSRNARPVGSSSAPFPSWQELGDIFFNKLHGRSPGQEIRYLSLLKLAEQVQAAFGRPALDKLLLDKIPDLTYEPSPLHSELLKLPWQDIFTTNFDTLLERARASVTLKYYDVVSKKEDLLYANKPRIVKLHGSFPSPPFVITEEDYRRYPIDHAPFVNTVRQSLLENTLCLIGFSGDDPNFLQWIGWIRDHIGKETAPKIYLVGVFNRLSDPEKRLLDGRGIVIIDLSMFNTDHEQALGKFLNYLKLRKVRAIVWPTLSKSVLPWASDPDSKKYNEIVTEWQRQRREYPGWVMVPEERRQYLWHYTERWAWHFSEMSSEKRTELGTPLDLNLAFELAWRLDRCIFPLFGELPAFLEEVSTKYSDTTLSLPEESEWTRKSISEAIVTIRLWLLRHYREEGMDENWNTISNAIEYEIDSLQSEHRTRFRYEEVLQALFRFDPIEAKRLLAKWKENVNLPFWEAKRAALMAELGDATTAHSILENSLSSIRQQLNLTPINEDYTLVSQESVVMLILWAVKNAINFHHQDREEKNLLSELSERWNELVRYKCEPRREITLLSARLGHPSVRLGTERTSPNFDLGSVTKTVRFGVDEELITAFGLLRMYEDIGLPYRVEHTEFVKKSIESALPRIRSHTPHWALVNYVRLADVKIADGLFDREYLANLSQEEVDKFVNIYLPAFERIISIEKGPVGPEAEAINQLAETLPEVFSRLCYKCSPECRERVFNTLVTIYSLKWRQVFENITRFTDRILDSMSVEERVDAIPILLDIPVPDRLNELEKTTLVNPIRLVKLPVSVTGKGFSIENGRINELLDMIENSEKDRDWAATSLIWLHKRGKVNKQQAKRFGELLWNEVDAMDIPSVDGYSSFVCINFPHPDGIDIETRVKDHILSMIHERLENSFLDQSLNELRKSTDYVKWSKVEIVELTAEFMKWWRKNNHKLRYHIPIPFGSPDEITKRTIRNIVCTLSVLISQLPEEGKNDSFDSLNELLSDLSSHEIPALELEAAAISRGTKSRKQIAEKVATALLDNDDVVVRDALIATKILLNTWPEKQIRENFTPLTEILIQGIQWRHRTALASRLSIVTVLVEKKLLFLSTVTLNKLIYGLGKILKETETGVKGNDQDGVISLRASGASLAYTLYRHYRMTETNLPETIQRWRDVCSNPNEFSEIRNSWLDLGSLTVEVGT